MCITWGLILRQKNRLERNNMKKRNLRNNLRNLAVIVGITTMAAFLTSCGGEGAEIAGELARPVVDGIMDEVVKPAARDLMDEVVKPAARDAVNDVVKGLKGEEETAGEILEGGSFEVHFIDVGQADAALVLCDGESMLIDGGNAGDSSLIYAYLEQEQVDVLDYIVCTHAHEDHVGGLSGALNYAEAKTVLAPVTEYNSKAFRNFVKYLDQQGVTITIPEAGDRFSLGSAQVDVLGPVSPSDEPNNTSIVLKITYGETSFLFTGDAERQEEQEILDAGFSLDSTVLKVGHHGSNTSSSYPFLREVMPEYAVISVGRDNEYGHPTEEVLSRLEDAGAVIYRTDELGHIVCTSDGKTVSFK